MFSTGALPSIKDERDIKDNTLSHLNKIYDIYTDIEVLNVEYQKKVGACTACVKSYVEYLYFLKTGKSVRLSMAFLYIVTKLYIDKNFTEGSQLRSVLKALMKYGVCTEDTFPSNFDLSHPAFLSQSIPQKAWDEALNYRIGGYISIPVEESIMAAALEKYKLLYVRYELGEEWYTAKDGRISWNKNDILPLRPPEIVISGHAVLLNGAKRTDTVTNFGRNTWSTSWADNGNFFTDYSKYKPTEAWAITLDSVVQLQQDKTPIVADSTWRSLLKILRDLNIIK